MDVTLSEGSETPPEPAAVPIAQAEPLSPVEADALLDRLPALAGEPSDQVVFRLPDETLPAPRPGDTIDQLIREFSDHRLFQQANMFFGGVHVVRVDPRGGIDALGDPRRSGVGVVV